MLRAAPASGTLIPMIALAAVLVACEEDPLIEDAGPDSGADAGDATTDVDEDTDGGSEEDAGEANDDAGYECVADTDCPNLFGCHEESCLDGICGRGQPLKCSPAHRCIEALGGCDCSNPNIDGDFWDADECLPPEEVGDCDDDDPTINPRATEVCDQDGVDEDCNPLTFHNAGVDGDDDSDGFIASACSNLDDLGERHRGDDCRDNNPTIRPGNTEVCDYQDNDCNGVVDEAPLPGGGKSMIPGGLEEAFYPDRDHDGCGDMHVMPVMECGFLPLPGFIRGQDPCDCDDENPLARNNALEVCDDADNDCDELVDHADPDLVEPYHFPQTEVVCKPYEGAPGARFVIEACPPDLRWCTDIVDFGCTTDATTLDNCRACGQTCTFACGQLGCDEVVELALGSEHSCARTMEGAIACWGYGPGGRLGGGFQASTSEPNEVIRIDDARVIAIGPSSSCAAVRSTGDLYCWGSNVDGLLASTDVPLPSPELPSPFSAVPVPVSGYVTPRLQGVTSVAVGHTHACAARSTGDAYCWGSQLDGRLGNGFSSPTIRSFPAQVLREMGQPVGDAIEVVVGEMHACLLTAAQTVDCWGANFSGELGNPAYTEFSSDIARPVPGLDMVSKLSASRGHTCALRNGQVLCWGLNDRYQLGREMGADNGAPGAVPGLEGIKDIAAGPTFTCAIDAEGAVWCWGSNDSGERGSDVPGDSAVPQRIEMDEPMLAVFAGTLHACALSENNEAVCWGSNSWGQLGNGDSSDTPAFVPQAIRPLVRSR